MTDGLAGPDQARRRVVVVGGGAAGTLVAIQLLRRGGPGIDVVVVEPREALGQGVAFGTTDPWHRLNVPAATMSGLADDPDHFRRWAAVDPLSFPSRLTFGRYLQALLLDVQGSSAGSVHHVRDRVERLVARTREPITVVTGSAAIAADAVVLATGNELPPVPPFADAVATDSRFVRDPWSGGALDEIGDSDRVAILGTGHTAMDLAASVLRRHAGARVIALSRHGEIPRPHDDPWRPRPPTPVFTVEEFARFKDPLAEAADRIGGFESGWRQGLDSLRPILQSLWLTMSDETRRRFLRDWRHRWEIHRSRLVPEVVRDVEAWIADDRLEIRSAQLERVRSGPGGLRVEAAGWSIDVDRLLLATGPDERPAASPLLAALVHDGLARPASIGLGLDVDPATLRIRDARGGTPRPIHALGPVVKGSLWETSAIPEIRDEASLIARQLTGEG